MARERVRADVGRSPLPRRGRTPQTPGMRRLLARLALTAGVVCAGAAVWPAPHATAADGVQASYWWRAQAAPSQLPIAPQGVPDGGLYVASDPTGAEAIAAVRANVPAWAAPVTLSLVAVSSTGTNVGLEACATTGWTPTEGAGQWADRPASPCTPLVQGVQSADGVTWFFNVTGLIRGGVLDVLIQPSTSGVFSDSFARPTAQSISFPTPAPSPSAIGNASAPVGSVSAPAAANPPVALPTQSALPPPSAAATPQLAPSVASTPASAVAPVAPTDPRRAILAIAAVMLAAVAWLLRTRVAVTAAGTHPLAQPLRLQTGLAEHTLAGESA